MIAFAQPNPQHSPTTNNAGLFLPSGFYLIGIDFYFSYKLCLFHNHCTYPWGFSFSYKCLKYLSIYVRYPADTLY